MSENLWPNRDHVEQYLGQVEDFPHRAEGELVLLDVLASSSRELKRVLDIGTGDGRLLAVVREAFPVADCVGLDFSPLMIERFHDRFGGVDGVEIIEHDLDRSLPDLGVFDAVVSSFAIHHVDDDRKKSLYSEIFDRLRPGGVFVNLEHVASPTPELHEAFREAFGIADQPDDPSNRLTDVWRQLEWLEESGFAHVDCLWKWREIALISGVRP